MTDEDFRTSSSDHLRGTFTCAPRRRRAMREQGDGGRIIVVGSPRGQFGNFGQTNYAAAKAGIVALRRRGPRARAQQCHGQRDHPTAWTQMTASIPIYAPLVPRVEAGEQLRWRFGADHAIGLPDDCAPLVVFLAFPRPVPRLPGSDRIGGDKLTLYSHAAELAAAYQDGGWDVDEIAREWSATLRCRAAELRVELPDLDLFGIIDA